MNPRRRFARPRLQSLEGRDVPTNLTVAFSPLTHTLTVVGDADANDVTVRADPADPTHFALTSTGTINGQAGPYSSSSGVRNLAFKMLAGDDTVTFDTAVPIHVTGSLSVDGGDGANTVSATDLTVDRNLSITNGAHRGVVAFTLLANLSVGGSVSIRSAAGGTDTRIQGTGVSTIRGSLRVTNGTGNDLFTLTDTNVDGDIVINNGHGNAAGSAGRVEIANFRNTAFRSVIGGNLTVTYLDGDGVLFDAIWDTEVRGNLTLNHGSGAFQTAFDGFQTFQPDLVRGNVTVTGTGANSLRVGEDVRGTGLVVGGRFALTSGGTAAATVTVNKLQVGGSTAISLGGGDNAVGIDESLFAGRFTLTTGAGNDTVNIETTAGTLAATVFERGALLSLGAGGNVLGMTATLGGPVPDTGQVVVAWGTFIVTGGAQLSESPNVYFPDGGHLQLL